MLALNLARAAAQGQAEALTLEQVSKKEAPAHIAGAVLLSSYKP
ncbi:MAG: hypothetical protein ACJ8CR_26035 [Roseiflexaceae bacterium]